MGAAASALLSQARTANRRMMRTDMQMVNAEEAAEEAAADLPSHGPFDALLPTLLVPPHR